MAIADKTIPDLVKAVLVKLNVIRAGVEPSALRSTQVTTAYQLKFLELEDDNLGYWVPEIIPGLVFLSLVKIMCKEVSVDFGYAANDPEMLQLGAEGMDQLRKLQVKKSANEPVEAEYL